MEPFVIEVLQTVQRVYIQEKTVLYLECFVLRGNSDQKHFKFNEIQHTIN